MSKVKTGMGRRSFIKNVSLASGGLIIGFNWMACKRAAEESGKEWHWKCQMNGLR
jgi:isoquinoline 1-oxidoreductase subunit beta